MNNRDQQKLIEAGYTIIRERDYTFNEPGKQWFIAAKGQGGHDWHHLEGPFPSKAARSRRMKKLLQSKTCIED